MAEYIQVKDHPDLVRDTQSHAIVNTNMKAYQAAVERSRSAQKQRDELRDAVRDINNLKCEMHEIKSLLLELVDKK
jgi:benzoyl-CoA reductase/2-hydroxyglutaryl-CoA dehydratase subunit BcrC/BadD/HgdB